MKKKQNYIYTIPHPVFNLTTTITLNSIKEMYDFMIENYFGDGTEQETTPSFEDFEEMIDLENEFGITEFCYVTRHTVE